MLLAELLKRVMRQLCVVLAAFLDARPVVLRQLQQCDMMTLWRSDTLSC